MGLALAELLVIGQAVNPGEASGAQVAKAMVFAENKAVKSQNGVSLYPDRVYYHRIEAISDMEMEFNGKVKEQMNKYLVTEGRALPGLVERSEEYFPMFEEVLEKHGLPKTLKNLAVVESRLDPGASSPVGAAGLWQIMPATGKELGLAVHERDNPEKSTEAAAKYLKRLHGMYDDWLLALAAYNCGPGNVNKAIRKAGGEKDFWAISAYLPKETRDYVPRFIAASYVMEYHNTHLA